MTNSDNCIIFSKDYDVQINNLFGRKAGMGTQTFTILMKPTTLRSGDEIIFNSNRRRLYFSRNGQKILLGDDKDGVLIGNIDRPEEFFQLCKIITATHQLDVDFDWNANNSNYWKIKIK